MQDAAYSPDPQLNRGQKMKLRTILYRHLEVADSETGRALNGLLMLLIVVNVVAVVIESVQTIYDAYQPWFDYLELLSVAVFSVEYVARLWVSVESPARGEGWRARLRYALTPLAIVDLLAILPFYFGVFFDLDLRFLRALRMLRVFKLTRHSTAMDLLLTVIRNEAATVGSSLLVMVAIIVMAASGIYLIESDAQPEAFQSIPHAMWWAAVTLTTVGYGDVVPITIGGKIFGLVITLAGVGMVALPAGILASGFSQELRKRRAEYKLKIQQSLTDGTISARELYQLQDDAIELGLSANEASLLLKTETTTPAEPIICPHCGKEFKARQ